MQTVSPLVFTNKDIYCEVGADEEQGHPLNYIDIMLNVSTGFAGNGSTKAGQKNPHGCEL